MYLLQAVRNSQDSATGLRPVCDSGLEGFGIVFEGRTGFRQSAFEMLSGSNQRLEIGHGV